MGRRATAAPARLVTERGPGDLWESNYFWAAIVGLCGAFSSVAFREALNHLQLLLLHYNGPLEDAATTLPWWGRLLMPTAGGLIAGIDFAFRGKVVDGRKVGRLHGGGRPGQRRDPRARHRGEKPLVARDDFVRRLDRTRGSHGATRLDARLAARARLAKFSPARLRLLVACGAAAGIACAYNAPLTGAFFVAEIVLGSIAMESIGPLIVSSVVATVDREPVPRRAAGLSHAEFRDVCPTGNSSRTRCSGVVAGLCAPLFLLLLRGGRNGLLADAPARFAQARAGRTDRRGRSRSGSRGVWGNGYGVVEDVLNNPWTWQALMTILVLKVLATVATTGSGAVGGVFTPTLFCGAVLGALFGEVMRALLPHAQISVGSFAVVGMGCFLAAMTRAPIMSILIMFEMTRDDATIMPLMLACVSAFYVARSVSPESVYSRQLHGGNAHSETPLFLLHVRDLMKKDPLCVLETPASRRSRQVLAANTFKHLYVVDANRRFLGAIALQDLKPFLHDTDLPQVVIALDLMHDDIPVADQRRLAEGIAGGLRAPRRRAIARARQSRATGAWSVRWPRPTCC